MSTPLAAVHPDVAAAKTACRIGFPASLTLAAMAALGFLLGIATPPRSGPYCLVHCTLYPFTDAARFFPRDYFWMAPGILLTPLFTIVTVCLYMCVPARSKPWALLAAFFSAISTAFITFDYFVQILVIQPSLESHEADGVALFTQYNPHGMFIALEDLGYLLLAVSFAFLCAAIPITVKPGKAIRWTLGLASFLGVGSFLVMGAAFGTRMGLMFELAIITIIWIALVVAGILLARFFLRAAHNSLAN